MGEVYKIFVPNWRPVRDNQLTGAHHFTKHRLKRGDAEMVTAYARMADIPRATTKRRVWLEITLVGRQRECDPLSFAKSTLDALKLCGMLVDDNSKWCDPLSPFARYNRNGEAGTTIVLEDIEEV